MAVFKTDRLTIRKISDRDIDKLAPILSDNKTMKYTETGAQNREQMIEFVQRCISQYSETGFGHWAISITKTNELIGLCGLNLHLVDEEECLHANYRLGTKYQGQGYATETVNGLKTYCASQLKFNDLSAIIEPSNIESISVVERTGFKLIKRTMFKNMDVHIYQTVDLTDT